MDKKAISERIQRDVDQLNSLRKERSRHEVIMTQLQAKLGRSGQSTATQIPLMPFASTAQGILEHGFSANDLGTLSRQELNQRNHDLQSLLKQEQEQLATAQAEIAKMSEQLINGNHEIRKTLNLCLKQLQLILGMILSMIMAIVRSQQDILNRLNQKAVSSSDFAQTNTDTPDVAELNRLRDEANILSERCSYLELGITRQRRVTEALEHELSNAEILVAANSEKLSSLVAEKRRLQDHIERLLRKRDEAVLSSPENLAKLEQKLALQQQERANLQQELARLRVDHTRVLERSIEYRACIKLLMKERDEMMAELNDLFAN